MVEPRHIKGRGTLSTRLFEESRVIRVDPHKCDGCGICVYDCGADVFRFTNKKDKVFPFGNKYCVNCFLCELVCPEGAIEVVLQPKKKRAVASGGSATNS